MAFVQMAVHAYPVDYDDRVSLSFSVKTFFENTSRSHRALLVCSRYFFYTDNIQGLVTISAEFINYSELFDYSQVTDHQVLDLSFVILLTIIGSIHFIHSRLRR